MKYELARDLPTVNVTGVTLHRIRALRDVGPVVKAGDIGGYVQSETNLSQDGYAWAYEDSMIYDRAHVSGDAMIMRRAIICDNARVSGRALIGDDAQAFSMAHAHGDSRVCGTARIHGNSEVSGRALISGDGRLSGNVHVCGSARVSGGVVLSGLHYTPDAVVLFGSCDMYSRIVCQVDDVAYIGAGCRWFTLAEARRHWGAYANGARDLALCLLEGAANIARLRGWSEE